MTWLSKRLINPKTLLAFFHLELDLIISYPITPPTLSKTKLNLQAYIYPPGDPKTRPRVLIVFSHSCNIKILCH